MKRLRHHPRYRIKPKGHYNYRDIRRHHWRTIQRADIKLVSVCASKDKRQTDNKDEKCVGYVEQTGIEYGLAAKD